MGATQASVSIGDEGVLNVQVSPSLSDVWIDRDLSWLDFNERVLAEAVDERTPLLERAKFLAIFTANLDEFFMKRIAVLRETLTPERFKLLEQLREKLLPMLHQQAECLPRFLAGCCFATIVVACARRSATGTVSCRSRSLES